MAKREREKEKDLLMDHGGFSVMEWLWHEMKKNETNRMKQKEKPNEMTGVMKRKKDQISAKN